jgi:hypothetical protein
VTIAGRVIITATLGAYPHLMLPPLHCLPAKHKINFSTRKTRITHQLHYRTDLCTLTSLWKIILWLWSQIPHIEGAHLFVAFKDPTG